MEGQNGRTRYFKGHEAGTADVLAIAGGFLECVKPFSHKTVYWIECKADQGRQSELQKAFQQKVEAEGHIYILARGIDDLERAGL
jgi:hypothetical protein